MDFLSAFDKFSHQRLFQIEVKVLFWTEKVWKVCLMIIFQDGGEPAVQMLTDA